MKQDQALFFKCYRIKDYASNSPAKAHTKKYELSKQVYSAGVKDCQIPFIM